MVLPPLLNGVLPDGTYHASLSEIWQVFDHPRSTTRPRLNQALQHASALIWAKDSLATIFVDGSYITDKIDPIDVDLAVRSDIWDDTTFAVDFALAYPGEERLIDFFFNRHQTTQRMEDLFREIQGSNITKGVIQLLP